MAIRLHVENGALLRQAFDLERAIGTVRAVAEALAQAR
jgi:hypothetical protein